MLFSGKKNKKEEAKKADSKNGKLVKNTSLVNGAGSKNAKDGIGKAESDAVVMPKENVVLMSETGSEVRREYVLPDMRESAVGASEIAVGRRQDVSKYYLRVSKSYRNIRYVLLVTLVVFMLFMLTAYKGEITTENMRYLIKYLDISLTDSSDEFTSLHFDADSKMDFAAYGSDFAVATKTNFTVFDQLGNAAVNQTVDMLNPVIEASSKYILLYDRGGFCFYVFNSFSLLFSDTTDNPINAGCISDSGAFAIASSDASYLADIHVYDRNFNRTTQIRKDKYVTDIALSDDGKHIAVCSMYTDGYGQFNGETMVYDILGRKTVDETEYTNEVPLQVKFTEDGGLTVIFSDAVRFLSEYMSLRAAYIFNERVSHYCMAGSGVAAVISENEIGYKNRYIFITEEGNEEVLYSFSGKVNATYYFNSKCYIVTSKNIICIDSDNIYEYDTDEEVRKIVCNDKGIVFVCYSNKAKPLIDAE